MSYYSKCELAIRTCDSERLLAAMARIIKGLKDEGELSEDEVARLRVAWKHRQREIGESDYGEI